MESEYRAEAQQALTEVQAHFDANPLVRRRGGVARRCEGPAVLEKGAARFARTCASCHGEKAQGLIGPNLTDDRWITAVRSGRFSIVAKGWPAKGMPPWGRVVKPEELSALVSYVRSLQGSNPPSASRLRRTVRAGTDPGS